MAVVQAPAGGRRAVESQSLLAAFVTFIFVTLIVTATALIAAPTGGARLLPLPQYLAAAWKASPVFIVAGIVLGMLIGLGAAYAIYQVWGNRSHRQEAIAGYLFLLPYLIITLVFTVGVLFFAFYISFYRYDIFTAPVFVGLQNYTRTFRTQAFVQALYNVFWYSVIVTIAQTTLALLLAALLDSRIRGRNAFRTLYYLPSVTSSVVISLIFWWLFLRTGYINFFLTKLLALFGMQWTPIEWLNDPRGLFQIIAGWLGINIAFDQWYLRGPSVTWMALMFQNIYTTIPTYMLMFLAALQGIPPSVYEAGSIDGATPWQRFTRITVPMLRPAILLVVVLGTIGTLQIFDQVNILTDGGPLGTTLSPVFLVYREALGTEGTIRMGYASAMAFILAIIIFIFTFFQRRVLERGTENY